MSRSLTDPPHDVEPRADLAALLGDACGLPLLRERDGRLEQAVHVAGPASIALGGEVLDRRADAGFLFVPALDAPRTFTLELGGGTRELELTPQRRFEVSVIHHSHLDIGYTDPQARVLEQHLEYLDAALDLTALDDGFRWNVEANLPLTQWLSRRPAADREAFLQAVGERRIEVCALPFTMHTEAYSLDELARTLRPAQALRERYGIEIVTAMQTDVPGATIGLCELLAAADVRYLSVAHNYAGRSVPHLHGGQELRRPFWWRAPSGRRLLVWHTDSPHGIAYMEGNIVGLADGYETTLSLLPAYLHALTTRPYPYSAGSTGWLTGIAAGTELTRAPHDHDLLHLRVQSAFADNAAPSATASEIVRRWNEEWAFPRLRMATNRDFFEAAEERLGDAIPTYEGDWTDWWADGIGSAAHEVGRARRAQTGVRTAQTLHAWADALGEDRNGWRDDVERVYEDLALFDEHTWGAANPWTDRLEHVDAGALQWRWKAARAHDAAEAVDALLEGARARLAAHVPRPAEAQAGVLVVNPGPLARTDVVELLLPETRVAAGRALAVVDVASGERMPAALEPQPFAAHRPRGLRLRFLARDVPPAGFARYAIVADREGVPEPAAGDPKALETDRFAARLDAVSGCLSSLTDGGAELVNGDSAFGFNQYVYDRYATASRVNHLSSRVGEAGLWLLASRDVAGDGVLVRRTSSALEERAVVRLRAPAASELTVTYRLVHGGDRLDVLDTVVKTAVTDKEAVFVAFPFALEHPRARYEITGGVHADGDPTVPGSADHMRAVRGWVALQGGERTVALGTHDAPLVQVGATRIPYAPFPPSSPGEPATVFSWAMNNGWDTNFPLSQGGEIELGYAVATGDPRVAAAPPLVGILSSPRSTGELPERGRLCALPDGVELLAVGGSRSGDGLVAHVHSLAAEPVDLEVAFPDLPVEIQGFGDHLERPRGNGVIRPGELVTVALA
jgi:Glycosyl hydrolases family 38 N-terminal domain